MSWQPSTPGLSCWALEVSKLPGGHSGLEIDRGYGNAIQVLAETLDNLAADGALELVELTGGNARNAIPSRARAVFLAPSADAPRIGARVATMQSAARTRLAEANPVNGALTLTLTPMEEELPESVMHPDEAAAVLTVLRSLPHGVVAMSAAVPGLVETSTNLAYLRTVDGHVRIDLLSRSSIDEDKHRLAERIKAIFIQEGFSYRSANDYPGWKPVPDSDVVAILKEAHLEATGVPLKIEACHAGLECGLIGEAFPELQMVSFGPTIRGAHTPEERVSISSVGEFWKVLRAAIEKIAVG